MREIIIDKTQNSDHGIRGVEVLQWLKQNKNLNIEEHVIFDDDSDFLIWQARNFIKINAYCGITPCDFYKAKRIFSKEDLNYY